MPNISKVPLSPDDDVMQFIIEFGNLQDWERTILQIVRRRAYIFFLKLKQK